jgi:hypothetical protein
MKKKKEKEMEEKNQNQKSFKYFNILDASSWW